MKYFLLGLLYGIPAFLVAMGIVGHLLGNPPTLTRSILASGGFLFCHNSFVALLLVLYLTPDWTEPCWLCRQCQEDLEEDFEE